MSSPFQKNFSAKSPMSPLNGAYENAADNPVYVSQAPAFAKLQSDIKDATLTAMKPKVSKCDSIRNNWHAGEMTDKAYADASKDCGGEKKPETKIAYEKAIDSGITPGQMDKVFDAGSLLAK